MQDTNPKSDLQIRAIFRPDPSFGRSPSKEFINATSDVHPKVGTFNQSGPCDDPHGIHGLAYGLGDIKLKSSFAKQLVHERLYLNPDISTPSSEILNYSSVHDEEAAKSIVLPRSRDGMPLPLPVTSSATFYSPKINLLNKHLPSPSVKRSVTKYTLPQHHPLYHASITKAISDFEQYREKPDQFSGPLAHILANSTYANEGPSTQFPNQSTSSSLSTVPYYPTTPTKPPVVHDCDKQNCQPHTGYTFAPARISETVTAVAKSDYHKRKSCSSPFPSTSHHHNHHFEPADVLAGCTGVARGNVNNVCGRPRCLCPCGDPKCAASFTPDFLTLNKHVQYNVLQTPSVKGKLRKHKLENGCACNCDVNCACACLDDQDCDCGMGKHLHKPEYYTRVKISENPVKTLVKASQNTNSGAERKTPTASQRHRSVYAELRENQDSENQNSENNNDQDLVVHGSKIPIGIPDQTEFSEYSYNSGPAYTPSYSTQHPLTNQKPQYIPHSQSTSPSLSSPVPPSQALPVPHSLPPPQSPRQQHLCARDIAHRCDRGCTDYWQRRHAQEAADAKLASIHHPKNPVHQRIHNLNTSLSASGASRPYSGPSLGASPSKVQLSHANSHRSPQSAGAGRAGVVSVRVNTYTALDHPSASKDAVPYVTDRALLIAEREKALLQWQTMKLAEEEHHRNLKKEEEDHRHRAKPWDNSGVKDFYFRYGYPRSAEYEVRDAAYGPNSSSGVAHAYTPKKASARQALYPQMHSATDQGSDAMYHVGDVDSDRLADIGLRVKTRAEDINQALIGNPSVDQPQASPQTSPSYNSTSALASVASSQSPTSTAGPLSPSTQSRPPRPASAGPAASPVSDGTGSRSLSASETGNGVRKTPFFPADSAFSDIDLETPRPAPIPRLQPTPAPVREKMQESHSNSGVTPALPANAVNTGVATVTDAPTVKSPRHAEMMVSGGALAATLPTGSTIRMY